MEHTILAGCIGSFVGLSIGALVATAMTRDQTKRWKAEVDRYRLMLEDVDAGFRAPPIIAPAVRHGLDAVGAAFSGLDWDGVRTDG